MELPFARFLQIQRVMNKARVQEELVAWDRAAFVGYQSYLMTPLKKGVPHDTFEVWCRGLGLRHPGRGISKEQLEAEKERGKRNLERALAVKEWKSG